MKKSFIIVAIFLCFLYADSYCQQCGMSLSHHKETSHIVISDGEQIEVCSLHCVLSATKDGKQYDIRGFDNSTKSFMPISELLYVVGSSKKGAMSSESEFGFSDITEAERFIKENGGKENGARIIKGDEIIKYAQSKYDKDSKMIATNQAKMMEAGEQIAKEYCQNTGKIKANNIASFKIELKRYCKNIDESGLHAVALYLWNSK